MGKFNYTTSITGHRSVSVRRAIYQRSSPKDCCQRPQYRMGRPTPASTPEFASESTSIIDPTDKRPIYINKPKILCLHGGGQFASSFRSNLTDLRNALSEFDFLFPQAVESGNLWFRDPPGGKEKATTDPDWALDSITYLNDYVITHGPFHSILGFSQGVCMALLYLSYLQQNNKPISFEKVILLNGYLPSSHQGIVDSIRRLDISIPILKIVGKEDNFYRLGEELHKELNLYGKNPNLEELHIDKYLDHFPIMSGFSGFNRAVDFLLS